MQTLKGIFPDPKKPPKKNFIKENAKQLKELQVKNQTDKSARSSKDSATNLNQDGKSAGGIKVLGKSNHAMPKTAARSRSPINSDYAFKKGDMSEFLKRKEIPKRSQPKLPKLPLNECINKLCDVACQTIESELSALADKHLVFADMKEDEAKSKASGDTTSRSKNFSPKIPLSGHKGDTDPESERKSVRKSTDKDPYLPATYQKGVLPKYLRVRRDEEKALTAEPFDADCPPGHVPLPEHERKETLRMLRSGFADLVNELNKMPMRTDTLRMRTRKLELEKQLTKLEEGIKVFSRPKVFVRIDE